MLNDQSRLRLSQLKARRELKEVLASCRFPLLLESVRHVSSSGTQSLFFQFAPVISMEDSVPLVSGATTLDITINSTNPILVSGKSFVVGMGKFLKYFSGRVQDVIAGINVFIMGDGKLAISFFGLPNQNWFGLNFPVLQFSFNPAPIIFTAEGRKFGLAPELVIVKS